MKFFWKIIIGILVIFGLLGIAAGFYVYFIIKNVDYKFTGQELFDSINQYRVSNGNSSLELDLSLCDNLVERWWAIKEPGNAHKGFEEWLESGGLAVNGKLIPKYLLIGELYVTASTPNNAINFWLGSPGHRLTLEKPEFNSGCAYANDGTGVVIMAIKTEK